MSIEKPEPPRPIATAIIACDRAIREIGTNKVTLVGIFDRFSAPGFPVEFVGGTAVYARVTDAEGTYAMRLELVRLEDEQTIGRGEMPIDVPDRLSSYEVIFNIDRLAFERPGTYEFRLFANGLHVGGAKLHVVQVSEETSHGQD